MEKTEKKFLSFEVETFKRIKILKKRKKLKTDLYIKKRKNSKRNKKKAYKIIQIQTISKNIAIID